MILTRRFGALVARREFPSVRETEEGRVLTVPVQDSNHSDNRDETLQDKAA